jgi:serine/threonine protein kinase
MKQFLILTALTLSQSKNRQLEKLLKKPSSDDSRPMHVKDLAKFQCAQQYRNIPTSLDFHQSYPSESTREFCTLSDYLLETSPPSSVEDIYKLWDSVFSLLSCMEKAMDDLRYNTLPRYSVRHYANYRSRRTRLSSHQDIEPENIFICRSETTSPYEWQFKLSDLGLSHFKSAKNESLEEGTDFLVHHL